MRNRRMRLVRRLLAPAALALGALVPAAHADLSNEQALAERHAPIVRVVEQSERCGHGEPFVPTDVDVLLGNDTVALRGPWNPTDLVKIAPGAKDLVGRYEYHLDFPGDPLDPGCDYERWARTIAAGTRPTVYAHVVTELARPGRVSLQYWFFYPFNDFNNTHEGDWEMIQLVFDAADAKEALGKDPVEIGYSAHEGALRSRWDDDKLEVVDNAHPVVYPAAGSHANKYSAALWLGSSAEAGVGCDDTRGPHDELRPRVATIPSDPAAARAAFPWIAFEGRWGELQKAFYNGPTGPRSGRSRSPGPKGGATAAMRCRQEGSSARALPTSSARQSSAGRESSSGSCGTRSRRSSSSERSSRSRPSPRCARPGRPLPRCGSRDAARGARSSPRRAACTSSARASSSASECC